MTDLKDAVSIDFGHTRTKMAFYNPNTEQIELMTWGENSEPYTPSVFASEKNSGKIVVGEEAERIIEDDLKLKTTSRKWNPILDFKRDLGRYQKRLSKLLGVDPSKTNPSEHLMTVFLTELREKARKHPVFVGRKSPTTVYLTYTPRYDSDQIAILTTSAKNAGFETIEVVAEPLAAAQMFQAMGAKTTDDIVILDCGGWTLDFSYLHRSEDDSNPYNIEITDCKPIGGRDVDGELLKVVKRKSNNSNQVAADRTFFLRQVRRCKEAYCYYPESWDALKHQILVLRGQTVVLTKDDIQPIIDTQVERIGEAVKPHIERIKAELKDKGREEPVIQLVGGSSRLPGLKIHLENSFGLTVFESMPETEYAPVRGPLEIFKHPTEKKEDKHDTPSITTEKKKDTLDNPSVTMDIIRDFPPRFKIMITIGHPNAVSSVAHYTNHDTDLLTTVTGSTVYLWDFNNELMSNITADLHRSVDEGNGRMKMRSVRPRLQAEGFGVKLSHVLAHPYDVTSVDVSWDQTLLAVAAGNAIYLHELKTRRSAELTGHTDLITSIAFSRDSPFLVSGSRDKTIKLWDVVDRENTHTFNVHNGGVNWVTWLSTHGNYIASAGQDGTVRFHAINGDRKEEYPWRRHAAPVTWLGLLNCTDFDMNLLVSKDENNLWKAWRTHTKSWQIDNREHPDFSWRSPHEVTSSSLSGTFFNNPGFMIGTKDGKLYSLHMTTPSKQKIFSNFIYWKPFWRESFTERVIDFHCSQIVPRQNSEKSVSFRSPLEDYSQVEKIPSRSYIPTTSITSLTPAGRSLVFAEKNTTVILDNYHAWLT